GLIAALILGVQWKRSQPDAVEVELWSSRQMPAARVAPAPPPPPEARPEPKPEPKPVPKVEPKPEPPPPVKPDIAIKEDKKPPKPEPKKPDPEPKSEPKKPEPKPEPKKPESKPEPKKPEVKPEVKPEQPKAPDFSKELASETAHLKARPNTSGQQMSNAAAAEAEQRAAAGKRGMQDYANKIRIRVRGNIVLPPNIQGNPEAIFMVEQLPGGDILNVSLKRSSGNPSLDAAIERAIRKSTPLPPPDDPTQFRRDLEIKYKPFEE
ncbi:MAG: energy transducer TonB, partial [Azonexus sp.]